MIKTTFIFVLTVVMSVCIPVQARDESIGLNSLPKLAQMQLAGLLVLDSHNRPIISKQPDRLFVPASTTKLVTAYLALKLWGEEHQFKTDFFVEHQHGKTILWIKGYGDPFLISEELKLIAKNLNPLLKKSGISKIDQINLDTSWFVSDLTLPGTSNSDNPYDAIPSAIAANFNTLFLKKHNGRVESAEEQTPLTPLALELGKAVSSTPQRVNTGADPQVSQRYFSELLAEFLRQQGLTVSAQLEWGKVANDLSPLYQHVNSHTLAEMIKPMMKYSTNFIANQLGLMMAAEKYGAPVDAGKVKRLFAEQLAEQFDWSGALIEEGAGLSRKNRLSPQQLVELLQAFKPWKHLLPEVENQVFAKSGSLIGVSTLAGYFQTQEEWLPFALMMNQKTPYRYRNQVAKQLNRELNQLK